MKKGIELNPPFQTLYAEHNIKAGDEVVLWEGKLYKKASVKQCTNCGKYYIAGRPDQMYCNITDADGKTCQITVPQKNYLAKIDPKVAEYRKVYKKMWARYAYTNKMSKEQFDTWKKNAEIKGGDTNEQRLSEQVQRSHQGKERRARRPEAEGQEGQRPPQRQVEPLFSCPDTPERR